MRTSHDSDLLELELRAAPDPVRQVRRAALPGGGARQGPDRAVPAARQPAQRARVVPACCSCSTASARSTARRGSAHATSSAPARSARSERRDAVAKPRSTTARSRDKPGAASRDPPRRARAADRGALPRRRTSASRISSSSSPPRARRRDLGHFAAELALDPPQSSGDLAGPPHLDEDYLVLSTVHSAKGLEWEAVHVLALYDGNFPADMACGSAEEHRGGAPPAVRGDHARAAEAAPVRTGALLPPPASGPTTLMATASRRGS